MGRCDKPPVEDGRPPTSVLRMVNPVMRALLRSRFHRPLSKNVMLLTFTGRKSGRTYTLPVGRHQSDGELVVAAGGAWRLNLRDGAPVRVTLDGREHTGRADLEEDPDKVAQVFKHLLERAGVKPRDVGLKVNVDRSPTLEEIKPVVAQRAIARIHLDDAEHG